MQPASDHFEFRRTLGNFATGVAIAACRRTDGSPLGVTINSFSSVSLEPPLILFCLGSNSRVCADFIAADSFAIQILSAEQENIARLCTAPAHVDWAQLPTQPAPPGAPPLLSGCLGTLLCRPHARHEAGDHIIIIGRITQLAHDSTRAPLLYFRGQYHL